MMREPHPDLLPAMDRLVEVIVEVCEGDREDAERFTDIVATQLRTFVRDTIAEQNE
jgi:hypothetical protein